MARELFDLAGVPLVFTLWGAAVGFAFLPLRLHSRFLLVLPGPVVGFLLNVPAAVMFYPASAPLFGILFSYVFLLGLTALVMGPATFLISHKRPTTVARAVVCVTLCLALNLLFGALRPLSWHLTPLFEVDPIV